MLMVSSIDESLSLISRLSESLTLSPQRGFEPERLDGLRKAVHAATLYILH